MALLSPLNSMSHTEISALNERDVLDIVSRAVLNHVEIEPLVQDILSVVLPLGPFDMGWVRLLDLNTEATVLAGSMGCRWLQERQERSTKPLLRMAREVMQSGGRAQVIEDIRTLP